MKKWISWKKKKIISLPSVKEHVEGEPPEFEAFVWSIDEDTIDGYGTRWIHFTHRNCVVGEKSELQKKKEINKKNI